MVNGRRQIVTTFIDSPMTMHQKTVVQSCWKWNEIEPQLILGQSLGLARNRVQVISLQWMCAFEVSCPEELVDGKQHVLPACWSHGSLASRSQASAEGYGYGSVHPVPLVPPSLTIVSLIIVGYSPLVLVGWYWPIAISLVKGEWFS